MKKMTVKEVKEKLRIGTPEWEASMDRIAKILREDDEKRMAERNKHPIFNLDKYCGVAR
jgi:hypothetical protein